MKEREINNQKTILNFTLIPLSDCYVNFFFHSQTHKKMLKNEKLQCERNYTYCR